MKESVFSDILLAPRQHHEEMALSVEECEGGAQE